MIKKSAKLNLINTIREEIYKIFENSNRFFNGMEVVLDIQKDEVKWEPLYKFLENIFHDKHKEAADGFMFYGAYKAIRFKNPPTFYQYRHGITRKYFWLDEKGEPYDLIFEIRPNLPADWKRSENDPYYLARYEKISYQDAFKNIYKDLINSIKKACETNNCEIPEDNYLMSYSDYKILRDQMLEKAGYKVFTITDKQDVEQFGDKSLEEKWSNKYKRSIDCSNPKGFSQKAHCAARKKRESGEKTKSKSPFK